MAVGAGNGVVGGKPGVVKEPAPERYHRRRQWIVGGNGNRGKP